MSSGSSKFGNLAQAVRERTASAAAGEELQTTTAVPSPAGAGIHKPAAALASVAEGLRDRVARLETELAQQTDRNGDLERQLTHARHAVAGAGDALEEFLFLDPGQVNDPLPRDRLPGAFAGPAFDSLLADIQANGQNDAITVRRSGKQGFEIAAGRRRSGGLPSSWLAGAGAGPRPRRRCDVAGPVCRERASGGHFGA